MLVHQIAVFVENAVVEAHPKAEDILEGVGSRTLRKGLENTEFTMIWKMLF